MRNFLFPLLIIISCSACNRSKTHPKFTAPVEEVYQLDSTKIGISTIASDLNVPWEIAWGPDNEIWFTQQSGSISRVDPHTGKVKTLLVIPGVYRKRTLGLLGMAIYSGKQGYYVFVDYTHKYNDSTIVSRLVRYTFVSDTLKNPVVLLEVPGNTGHNGSRVAISPDGKVFWSTGDIAHSEDAQDTSSLNGKILRLNMDGSIPKDNPYPGSPIWSRGHRNIEGLVFTPDGKLFSSENGDATDDEINIIQKGGNYGWPNVQGYCDLPGEKSYCDSTPIIEPVKAWTPTIAPSGIDYYHCDKIPEWNNSILMATLKGESFRVLRLNSKKSAILSEKIYFQNQFGRLRDICVSPAGDIYISTSNRDWNPMGRPRRHDDRIIRIAKISDRDNLSQIDAGKVMPVPQTAPIKQNTSAGMALYTSYCLSCHKEDGNGIAGTFPALNRNPLVTGKAKLLTTILLKGAAAVPNVHKGQYDEKMASFSFLGNREIADVLTYIRGSWENHADTVSAAEVKMVRSELK